MTKMTKEKARKILEDFYNDRGFVPVRLESMAVRTLGQEESQKVIRETIRERNEKISNHTG